MAESKRIPLDIPLTGKCNNSDPPASIGTGFRTLKNLRYTDKGLKGVSGMTKLHSGAIGTYKKVRNAFHFRKEQPAESHVLMYGANVAEDATAVFESTVVIPNSGADPSVVQWVDGANAGRGRFSDAPNGDMMYCNGVDTCVWGGDEFQISKFINYPTNMLYDYTEVVRNTLDDSNNVAKLRYIEAPNPICQLYIGSVRPIKGIKFYVKGVNTQVSTMTGYYWDGNSWEALTSLVDGTKPGTVSLAQTGWVTFADTQAIAKVKILYGVMLYWYKINISVIDDTTTTISHVTLSASFQTIKDIWDGNLRTIVSYRYWKNSASVYKDFSVNVATDNYEDTNTGTYAKFASGIAANDIQYFGFIEPMCGISLSFGETFANETALTLNVYYWNGIAWTVVEGLDDGTKDGTTPYAKSGFITWSPIAVGSEFKTTIGNNVALLYYYKVIFSIATADQIRLYYAAGLPAQKNILGYKFPLFAEDRVWLCSEKAGDKNSAICLMKDTSSVINGEDSTKIYFGDESELTAATSFFARVGDEMYNVKLFFKKNELWSIVGNTPEKFVKRQISQKYGCVAPLTVVSANAIIGVSPKLVIVWQGSDGIYMFDQNSIIPIHNDIRSFFDKNATTKLNLSKIGDSTGFFDPERNEYHWLFATGSSTTLNNEWVFDFYRFRWFEIPRGTGKNIQCGCPVADIYGNQYTYGFIDTGYMERLEYGTTFDGSDIVFEFQFGDFPLMESIMYLTKIIRMKLIAVAKATTTALISISHYGDGCATESQTAFTHTSQKTGYNSIKPVKKFNHHEHTLHSLKFTITTNNEIFGFEPIMVGILGEAVREDLEDPGG